MSNNTNDLITELRRSITQFSDQIGSTSVEFDIETKQQSTSIDKQTILKKKLSKNIEYFSKDLTRVGMQLEFDYNLNNERWNHRGFSSKGKPLHEIWTLRKKE
jgi:predicted DsbA family dithiol-disulfide isomerase